MIFDMGAALAIGFAASLIHKTKTRGAQMSLSLIEKFISERRRQDRKACKTLTVGDLVIYEALKKRGRLQGRIIKFAPYGQVILGVLSKEFGVVEHRVPASMVRRCPEQDAKLDS